MKQSHMNVLISFAAMLSAHGLAEAEQNAPTNWLIPKQIAAPPEDFLSGMLRLPKAELTGRMSASAVYPIELAAGANGVNSWETVVDIGGDGDVKLVLVGPESTNCNLFISTDAGDVLALGVGEMPPGITKISDSNAVQYTMSGYRKGAWKLSIHAENGAVLAGKHHLLISDSADYQTYTHLKSLSLIAGQEISFVTYLCDGAAEGQQARAPQPLLRAVTKAELRLQYPDGHIAVAPMNDDGHGNDSRRFDSRFTGSVLVDRPGDYVAQIVVHGSLPDGSRIVRTSQHLVTVVQGGTELGRTATGIDRNDGSLRVDIPVRGVDWTDRLHVSAEVWGRDDHGDPEAVCWISGIVGNDPDTKSSTASLRLDKRWLARVGASAPFELRNVRVQDTDTHIPLTQRDSMALQIDSTDFKSTLHATEIDNVMRHGRREQKRSIPVWIGDLVRSAPRAFGAHNLMLIHGYCSQFPLWPMQDFDGFLELFQDAGQSRSHDEFAQLLLALGNQSKSFGVVAHSQGGAAALHLYTYYWSGLDWATGPRLIQSLGTPYQGTPLASDIAFLGEIFGSGCGTNFDLTPEGSALWLAGIPSSARAEVHYWTTSFEDGFGFDFCNIVTDFLLSDPDDGVIEKARGQLPGANNMGHTEGQCHTTGMRDPAQYSDVSRNIEMNLNAAR